MQQRKKHFPGSNGESQNMDVGYIFRAREQKGVENIGEFVV